MKPYKPKNLPLTDIDTGQLIRMIGPANAAIARYDGLLQSVVNPSVMLSPLTQREAVLSSRIEGTQATVDEVLGYDAGVEFDPAKQGDIQEIVNYRKALSLASEALEQGPIDLQLIKQMHSVLMNSVRGQRKEPGRFRADQNWIGSADSTIETAKFVPPSPRRLPGLLEEFANYMAGDDIDTLVQCAIVHAQFEILHPFKDGNGRIGRLLIPLFLFQKKALASPMFYLSEYLEGNRESYYQGLRNISDKGDWTGWIAFFLEALKHQAVENTNRVKGILSLYDDMKSRVTEITHSQHSPAILDALFDKPIFQSTDFVDRSNIPNSTAKTAIKKLRDAQVLTAVREASGNRPAVLAFRELVNLAEGRSVF